MPGDVLDQRQRDTNFGHSDGKASVHIPGYFAHDMEPLAKFGERMRHTSIECYPGGPGNDAQRPGTNGIVAGEHRSPMEAVHHDGVGGREVYQLLEALGDPRELRQGWETLQRDAAGQDRLAQQAVPGHLGVQPEQLLAERQGSRLGEPETDVVAQRADIGDVVVDVARTRAADSKSGRRSGTVDRRSASSTARQ